MTATARIGLIGLGEAGAAMCSTLAVRGDIELHGYDVGLEERPGSQRLLHRLPDEVVVESTVESLVASSEYVLSLVTSDAAVEVGLAISPYLTENKVLLEGNSIAPHAAREIASSVARAGSKFVDLAIMAAVTGRGHAVPMLASGRDADFVAESLNRFGFNIRAIGKEPGVASATKMMRSVVVKGIEALLIESLAAASAYGVADHVLGSLDESFPQGTWRRRADYFATRTVRHGARRAAELEHAAEAIARVGIDPHVTTAAARRLRHAVSVLDGQSEDEFGYAELAALVAGRSLDA